MAQQPNPARERVRGIVPKMIELSEQVIFGDIIRIRRSMRP
jgi:hypothetical protein